MSKNNKNKNYNNYIFRDEIIEKSDRGRGHIVKHTGMMIKMPARKKL